MLEKWRVELAQLVEQQKSIRKVQTEENRDLSKAEFDTINDILKRMTYLREQITQALKTQDVENWCESPTTEPQKPAVEGIYDNAEKRHFESLGEQLRAVAMAEFGQMDKRLVRAALGLNETVPSDGAFLLEPQYSTQLLEKIYQTGQVVSRCNRITIGANASSYKIKENVETSRANGSRWGGIKAYWIDEAGTKQPTTPKFGIIEITPKKLCGLYYATDELLQDIPALASTVEKWFGYEFDFRITDAIINGAGGALPLGIMNSGSLVTVLKETAQKGQTIVYENIVKMWSRLFAPNRVNAVWLINQDCEPQLHTMSIAIGTGGVPVYMPAGGASGQPYSTLYGRPVIPIEQCSTLGTTGDIILADLSEYILVDKGGMQSAVSIHLKFLTDESCFRFILRLNGQPAWSSALTPFSGSSNTLSPFVALATRA